MQTKIFATLGVIAGLALSTFGWDIAEPVIGTTALSLATATYLQTRRAKRAQFTDNGDGVWVVALQVGVPVAQAVNRQFGAIDALIDTRVLLGQNTLTTAEEYGQIAREVYRAVCAGQGKRTVLVLSGTVGLAAIIGQLIGINKFNVSIFQFDMATGTYIELPRANIDFI